MYTRKGERKMNKFCLYCGKTFASNSNKQIFCTRNCYLKNYYSKNKKYPVRTHRFSGKSYNNSPERILELKEKYKNGVTSEIMEEFAKKIIEG